MEKKIFNFYCLLCLLISHGFDAVGGAITAPEKVINFTNKYISSFVLSDQVVNVSWVLTNDLIAQVTPASTVGNDIVNNLTNQLTASQYNSLAQIVVCLYPKYGSTPAIMAVVHKVLAAIGKVVQSYYQQLFQKIGSMNTDGRGKNAKYLQVCRMNAQFITQRNVCICMQAVKNNLLQSDWNNIRGCVPDSFVHWSNCAL